MSHRTEEHDLEESCLSSCDCSDFTNLAEKYEEIVVKLSPCWGHGRFTFQCIQFLGIVSCLNELPASPHTVDAANITQGLS